MTPQIEYVSLCAHCERLVAWHGASVAQGVFLPHVGKDGSACAGIGASIPNPASDPAWLDIRAES